MSKEFGTLEGQFLQRNNEGSVLNFGVGGQMSHKFSARRFFAQATLALVTSTLLFFPINSASATTITLSDSEFLKFNRASGITNITGDGTKPGNIVLYKNVGIFGGINIDCAITTVAVIGSISNYDNPGSASTASGYQDNFMLNTVGGEVTIKLEFFEGGTYSGTGTGVPVVLKNVKITSIDLDSSSAAGSYQYTDFTGFQKYSMMNPTNLAVTSMASPSRVRFIAAKSGSRSSVPEDQVMVKYDALQTITMNFGNVVSGSTNYFGLVFSGWPGTGTPIEYSNVYNTPPESTSTTLRVPDNVATVIPLSAFGAYTDPDSNPFNQIRIATLPGAGTGTLQFFNGVTWVNVTVGQIISVSDIELGRLRFTIQSNTSFTFYVHDGLDYSISSYTLTLEKVASNQTIVFANPGVKAPNSTPFASGAESRKDDNTPTGLTPTLTSRTPAVCTVSGLDITPIATGICSIVATQNGDATYAAAQPVTQTFPIDGKSAQSITFNNPGTKTYDAVPFASAATATSGLPVTLTSLTPSICTVDTVDVLKIKMVTIGSCQIQASQPGDGTYAPAPVVIQTFLIQAGAPSVVTSAATAVGTNSATVNGTVNSFNVVTTNLKFCYGTAADLATCTDSVLANVTTNSAAAQSSTLTGLAPGTKYYYRISASINDGTVKTSNGAILSFTTAVSLPTAITNQIEPSTDVQTSQATLRGTVSANGKSLTVGFCYSKYSSVASTGKLTAKKSSYTTCTSLSGTETGTAQAKSKSINDLSNDTTYFYQIYISYTDGTTKTIYGSPLRFSTRSMNVATDTATAVGATTATLNGRVKSDGSNATISSFCYNTTGTTSDVGVLDSAKSTCVTATTPAGGNFASNQNSLAATSIPLTGLSAGSTYYFQAIATRNGSYTKVYGGIRTFTTTEDPHVVTTAAASEIVAQRATLNGTVNPNSVSAATTSFCYGTTNTVTAGAIDTCTVVSAIPASLTGNIAKPFSLVVDGLNSGTTYYFQARAVRGGVTVNGAVRSFVAGNPLAVTSNATGIGLENGLSTFKATLNGAVKSNGILTAPKFCYGSTNIDANNDGSIDTCTVTVSNIASVSETTTSPVSIFKEIVGLTAGSTYYFQTIAEGSGGRTSYGAIYSFKASSAPTAVTIAASGATANGATLNGTVNDNGDAANAYFCFNTTDSNREIAGILDSCLGGMKIANLDSGTASLVLSGLKAGTTYYFQVMAENSSGTTYGAILNFTTLAGPPNATTFAAQTSATGATLLGEVESVGANTSVSFCNTTSNAQTTAGILNDCALPAKVFTATPSSVLGSNPATVSVAYQATGLVAGTTYYFQVRATNSQGTTYGAVLSYVVGAPTVVTLTATNVASTSARLNGSAIPNGSDITVVKYCYLLSDTPPVPDSAGAITECQGGSPTGVLVDGPVTAIPAATASATSEPKDISSLTQGGTYYFQIYASNSRGTAYGDVLSFTVGVPVVLTGAVSDTPTSSSATLTGVLNPTGDLNALTFFCLSQSDDEGVIQGLLASCAQYESANLASGIVAPATTDINISRTFIGLLPATTYYYQAIVDGTNADSFGEIKSFTTAQAKIIFNNNSGSGTMASQTSPVKTAISTNTFTKDGNTFAGWNMLANGTGTSYANGADFAFDSDITLYAQWTNSGFTVTFNPNNGSGTMPVQTSLVAANLTVNAFTRSGYNFAGWNTIANGSGTPYSDLALYPFTGSAVLYAQWTAIYVAPRPTPTPTPTPEPTPKVEEKKEPIVVKLPQYTLRPTPIGTNKSSGNVVTTSSKPSKVEVPEIKTETPIEIKPEIKQELAKKVEITPTTGALEVKPVDGWTGKIQVPVVTIVNGQETEVFTDIVVNPEKPDLGKYLPDQTILQTSIKWDPSPSQVVKYVVEVNGVEVCQTATTTCKVPDAVGPKSKIEVTAIGNDNTKSEVTLPAYTPEKPVPALVVNFAESSAKLTTKAKKELEKIAAIISREGYTRLVVDGHTDSQGGQKNASSLSTARAKATKSYLEQLLPNVNFVLSGKGLEAPVASNKNEQGRAANRRAELRVW
jgi:uncharacterized repeat protein (TIGR02543 family)